MKEVESYERFRAEVKKDLSEFYSKTPEAEIEEYLKENEDWIKKSYSRYVNSEEKLFSGSVSGISYAMTLDF